MKATKEGKRFILAVFLIAVAAVNTGNNLIYLILSLMLSFILISIVLLKINMSGLLLEVSVLHPVFAKEQSAAIFSITNTKRLMPTYSVKILTAGAVLPVSFKIVPLLSTLKKEAKIVFKRRGIFRHGDFHIQSGFPFILFNKIMTVRVSGEVMVYPDLTSIENIIPEIRGYGKEEALEKTGHGDDIYSVREFKNGDDWKKIHWKASAKTSNLIVKEYAAYESKRSTVIVDNLMPENGEIFEKAVSLSGSLCKYFLDRGYLVRFISCKKVIPFGGGTEHFFRILDILTVIKEEKEVDCPVLFDNEGFFVLVLKSGNSQMNKYAAISDMVVYADIL